MVAEVEEKLCRKCGIVKPTSEFYKDKKNSDGTCHFCKICRINDVKTYAQEVRSGLRTKVTVSEKRCPKCREVKPSTDFHKDSTVRNGLYRYCKPCQNDRSSRFTVSRKYGLTLEDWKALRETPCEICGRTLDIGLMHIDHTEARSFHGVLCHNGNTTLGKFWHDPEIITKALDYVLRTRG